MFRQAPKNTFRFLHVHLQGQAHAQIYFITVLTCVALYFTIKNHLSILASGKLIGLRYSQRYRAEVCQITSAVGVWELRAKRGCGLSFSLAGTLLGNLSRQKIDKWPLDWESRLGALTAWNGMGRIVLHSWCRWYDIMIANLVLDTVCFHEPVCPPYSLDSCFAIFRVWGENGRPHLLSGSHFKIGCFYEKVCALLTVCTYVWLTLHLVS